MPTTTQWQNGQTLVSSALTTDEMDALIQQVSCQMLGVTSNFQLPCNLTNGSAIISTPLIITPITIDFIASGVGIPSGTTVIDMAGEGTSLLLTLSNNATQSGNVNIAFFDPASNSRVRISWPTEGAPAWLITDDVLFIRCVEEDDYYNKQRDEFLTVLNATQLTRTRTYTRVWRVSFVAYGPGAFDSLRLIKSALLETFSHDMLAASNLFLVPSLPNVMRVPELEDGQWWERSDLSVKFYEYVTETINVQSVATVPLVIQSSIGTTQNVKVVQQE